MMYAYGVCRGFALPYVRWQRIQITAGLPGVQLEFINDEIWANVWMTECIAKIDPRSGKVRWAVQLIAQIDMHVNVQHEYHVKSWLVMQACLLTMTSPLVYGI